LDQALFDRVRAAYDQVADLPPGERDQALRELAASDPAVADRVRRLLDASQRSPDFLHSPAAVISHTMAEELTSPGNDPLVGTRLGDYQIVGVLGAGGMGVVYQARQGHPRRDVALKLIRSPLIGPATLRRFEHEAQVLASLKHPGVAQVYDAGTLPGPDGRPIHFFAMELIRGRPLLDYALERALPLRQRLELFAKVCDAVHHAHLKGVVHRDLKPANIMVEESADSAAPHDPAATRMLVVQPKVLDFGVARVTNADLSVTTMQTTAGQVIGTLPYMSPEQVEGRGDQVDVRSDVYALGVVLYQLLVGRLPYDLRDKSLPDAARVIAEHDPANPGTALPSLRGEVETVLLKALAKEPARRYQSAADLAADLRRFLADLPILARPASTLYNLRKFSKRHRALVGGVLAALVLLVGGVVGTSIGMLRAIEAQGRAEDRERAAKTEAAKSARVIDFLIDMLTSADPESAQGRDVTVRELLDTAAQRANAELADLPEVGLAVESAIGRTYTAIGRHDSARAHLEAATALARRLHGDQSAEVGVALTHEASLAAADRRWADAESLGRQALDLLAHLGNTSDPRHVDTLRQVGLALAAQRRYAEAIPILRQALAADHAAGRARSKGAIETMRYLGVTLGRLGGAEPIAEGERMLLDAVEASAEVYGPESPTHARTLADLAGFYYTQSRSADARGYYEPALRILTTAHGPNDRRTLEIVSALGRTYMQLGDMPRALEFSQRAVDSFRESGQAGTAEYGSALSRLGSVLYNLKRYADAEAVHRQAADLRRTLNHADLPISLSNLGRTISIQGRDEEALPYLIESLEIERARGWPRPDTTGAFTDLAEAYARLGRASDAERTYTEGSAFARERQPNHLARAGIEYSCATFLHAHGRHADALPHATTAEGIFKSTGHARYARAVTLRAAILDSLGRSDEAAAARALLPPDKPAPPAAAAPAQPGG
jgi:eukaryotic-like serine/threonine-protein kinase